MTPLTVTTSDSSGTLPTGTVVVVSNVGTTNPMYCNVNGVAATTSDQLIGPNSWFAFTIPAAVTTLHCIATGGSTTANGVGGSGLATGAGGGSASGGGGTVVQGNAGSNAQAWWMRIGDATNGPAAVKAANTVASTDVSLVVAVANTNANGQAAASSSSPVVVAKNSGTGSTVAGAAVGTAGSASAEVVTVQGVASMTPVQVNAQANTTGGWTPTVVIAANSNNSTSLKGSAGMVGGVQTGNIDTAAAYLKLYDKATAPTCGTDTPVAVFLIPPTNSGNNGNFWVGKTFTLGIGYCIVAGIANNDNTSVPAAKIIANFDYK